MEEESNNILTDMVVAILGLIVGFIIAAILSPKKSICPICKGEIDTGCLICPHCDTELKWDDNNG